MELCNNQKKSLSHFNFQMILSFKFKNISVEDLHVFFGILTLIYWKLFVSILIPNSIYIWLRNIFHLEYFLDYMTNLKNFAT